VTSQQKTQRERVLRSFMGADGRLHTIPSKFLRGSPPRRAPFARSAPTRGSAGLKHAKLLVVLDRLAPEFEPGQKYAEPEVNEVLQRFHPDHAALRRYLVENDFLTREDGSYWRSGGTFEV
jgi:hypothetical protein